MDLALKAREVLLSRTYYAKQFNDADNEVLRRRVFVSMIVGITFMLRKSEHIGSTDKDPINRLDVTFFDESGQRILYKDVGKRVAQSVILNVQFAKTDPSNFGRRTRHI